MNMEWPDPGSPTPSTPTSTPLRWTRFLCVIDLANQVAPTFIIIEHSVLGHIRKMFDWGDQVTAQTILSAIDCSHSSIINSLCLWTWTMNVHISRRTHNLHSNQRFANKKHCKKKWSNFRVTEFSPLAAASPTCMVWCSPGIRHFQTSRWSPIIFSFISTNKTVGL